MPNKNCENEVGIKEITLAEMEDIIGARGSVDNYNEDCILNNEMKEKDTCR